MKHSILIFTCHVSLQLCKICIQKTDNTDDLTYNPCSICLLQYHLQTEIWSFISLSNRMNNFVKNSVTYSEYIKNSGSIIMVDSGFKSIESVLIYISKPMYCRLNLSSLDFRNEVAPNLRQFCGILYQLPKLEVSKEASFMLQAALSSMDKYVLVNKCKQAKIFV